MGQGVGPVSEDTRFPGMGWVWLGMDMAEAQMCYCLSGETSQWVLVHSR